MVMADLSEDQLSDSREVFDYFDLKGDGKVSISQVGDILRAVGQNPTEADIKKCCGQWPNPDARITFEQFVPIFQQIHKTVEKHTDSEFIEGLSNFDKEGSGMINVAELRHMLTTLGERLTDEEADMLLSNQEDSNGNLYISDLVQRIMHEQ